MPSATNGRPPASLSLDLDNQWSYMKTHGDAGWEEHPSYLDTLVDVVLESLERLGLDITVFIVGKDASLEKNAAALRRLGDSPHEVGNHSFHHEQWLHRYTPEQLDEEIGSAEDAIAAATGKRPEGFRGPGFALTEDTLNVLSARGYLYDASTFPTFLGPIARLYYFRQARDFSQEERDERSQLFGSWSDGLRPLRPYLWDLGGRELLEIPVTTMPISRAPFHMSYLLYLARVSPLIARTYLSLSLTLCRMRGVTPSFLLHPLDYLGADRCDALSFFPGMDLGTDFKVRFVERALRMISKRFDPVPMGEHARRALATGALPQRRFAS